MRLLAELRQQVLQENLPQASATMHAMKGMAATVGAVALAKWAADLELRAKTEKNLHAPLLFSPEVIDLLTDLLERSDAALAAAMPPDPATATPPHAAALHPISPAQMATRLLEIQAMLQVGNLRAIDMVQELLALAPNADKFKVQQLLDATQLLKFREAQSMVESWHGGSN